jgi:hypothetical protein
MCKAHLVLVRRRYDSYFMGRYQAADIEHWRGVLREQAASGQSMAGYCRERGLQEWQLYEWKKRLRRLDAAPFIAVTVSSPEAPVPPLPHTSQIAGIELRHRSGWALIVEPDFNASHLRRVLSVLEQCS